MIDSFLLDILKSPNNNSALFVNGSSLNSEEGETFDVIDGVPILLPNQSDTMDSILHSRNAKKIYTSDPYLVDSLGLNNNEKARLKETIKNSNGNSLDPVASFMVGATCGNAYSDMRGNLKEYPIPHFPLKTGNKKVLLDIGCNWGRWLISAAREGFIPIGIDPQIGALLAAKRITEKLGIKAHFICGDGRFLPIKENSLDAVYSYSVIQHLSFEDAEKVSKEIYKGLKPNGFSYIQMPTKIGLKGFMHRAKNKFAEPIGFDVRYWSIKQLKNRFGNNIGPTTFETDCFFGIGLQYADIDKVKWAYKPFFAISEFLKTLSKTIKPITYFADSVFVKSYKKP